MNIARKNAILFTLLILPLSGGLVYFSLRDPRIVLPLKILVLLQLLVFILVILALFGQTGKKTNAP